MKTLSNPDIEDIHTVLVQAGEIATASRSVALVRFKSDRSPFTDLEIKIETLLVEFLQKKFPHDRVLTEETGSYGAQSDRVWVLDPIDGTQVFLNGLPTWGVSLGMMEKGQPTLGFFYMPHCRDAYWGGPDYGSYLNGTSLKPAIPPNINDKLPFLAVPANAHRHFRINYPRIRAPGSTAANLCYTAQGAAIGTLVRRVRLWDIAGSIPLLAHTGIRLEFLSGKPFDPSDYLDGSLVPEDLLAAHPAVIDPLRAMIQA